MFQKTYIFYLPNLLRNYGYVEKYQIIHTDYKYDAKVYIKKLLIINPDKQQHQQQKKEKRRINIYNIHLTLI